MTVQEKITQLNEEVQEMHFKPKEGRYPDIAFFHLTLPNKVQQIKDFILLVAADNDGLLKCLEPVCFVHLDNELQEVKKVAGRVNPQNNKEVDDEMREHYLGYTSRNVNEAAQSFIGCCKKIERTILTQQIDNVGDGINFHPNE